jgi:hypothetical protein
VYYNSVWERAQVGGIVFSRVTLGQTVKRGDVLGTVTNPITNVRTRIVSNHNGRIIGMALNQVVQPGFATHHIGITPPKGQISPPEEVLAKDAVEARRPLDASVTAAVEVQAGNAGEEAAESEQADTAATAGDDEAHAAETESSADEIGDEDLEED